MIEDRKTLNDYGEIQLTSLMSELVEMFNTDVNNTSIVDNLLSYVIDTGIFRTGNEKVCNLSVGPHNNIEIPTSKLGEVRFDGFAFYFKSLHKIFTEIPLLDISSYNDELTHYIYLKPDKTYSILETKYTGADDYLYIGRFVSRHNEIVQFYLMTRNAGTNPFDKDGVSYEVINGLEVSPKTGLSLKVSDGVIKYSGINILSETSTDILSDGFEEAVMPLRYNTSDNTVNWVSNAVTDIVTNKIMDYSTGTLSDVANDKFICQKVFYDYPTKSLVMQYGSIVYDTFNEALAGANNFRYPEPNFNGAYIPIAVCVIKAGVSDLTVDGNFKAISITNNSNLSAATAVDPTAQALANSALAAAQTAQETADGAQSDATQALSDASDAQNAADAAQGDADTANRKIDDHLLDENNPHSVTKAQVGLGNVDNTADSSKPLSTAQKAYVDGVADDLMTEINKKPNISSQQKVVVKATQPTDSDYGRTKITGDIWIIP